jgi:hypothetical protein
VARRGRRRPRRAVASCSGWMLRVADRSARWLTAQQRAGVDGGHRAVRLQSIWSAVFPWWLWPLAKRSDEPSSRACVNYSRSPWARSLRTVRLACSTNAAGSTYQRPVAVLHGTIATCEGECAVLSARIGYAELSRQIEQPSPSWRRSHAVIASCASPTGTPPPACSLNRLTRQT